MTDYQMDSLIQAQYEYLQELEEQEGQQIEDLDDEQTIPWSIQ